MAKEGITIKLPDKPGPYDFEDYIAASILALGYFVETNITLKEGSSEILELDTVATPIGDNFLHRILIDAKTGSWSFRDLFTLYGWVTFLGIDRGILGYRDPPDPNRMDGFESLAEKTGASAVQVIVDDPKSIVVAANGISDDLCKKITGVAWFSRIVERLALKSFNDYCKSKATTPLVQDAKKYQRALQQAFFEKTAISRVRKLYEAWQSSPNLCGKFVDDLAMGGDVKPIWNAINDTEERLWLQYICILEHKARLGIIKNAIEHAIDSEGKPKTDKISWIDALEQSAPKSFYDGLEELRSHVHRTRFPYLFQIFIQLFGGFYHIGINDDLQLMSTLTGIPISDLPECFKLWNRFFPVEKDWFYTQKNEICCMKMVPAIYHGIGAFLRTKVFELKNYTERYPQQSWLLTKWHNVNYKILLEKRDPEKTT